LAATYYFLGYIEHDGTKLKEKKDGEEDGDEEDDEDEMAALLGFSGFSSTKVSLAHCTHLILTYIYLHVKGQAG
jgi:hypothetical protein